MRSDANFFAGQSFVAPCDGDLTVIQFFLYGSGNINPYPATITMEVEIREGAGGAGAVIGGSASTVVENPPPFSFSTRELVLDTPAAVTAGQVYTLFLDFDGDRTSLCHYFTNDPAADVFPQGDMYYDAGSGISNAVPGPGADLRFAVGIAPTASTVATSDFYNPSAAQGDGSGWRLLSSPVPGLTVDDLAAQNLVQGVAAGATSGPQYPDAGANVLTSYDAATGFEPPPDTDAELTPGRGFYWYFYDRDITPDPTSEGGGTSQSVELTGFSLSATGFPLSATTQTTFDLDESADGFYMVGSPFAEPFGVAGITVTGGTIQNTLHAFDPSTGGFVQLFQTNGSGASDVAAVWQGLLAEIVPNAGSPGITVAYDVSAIVPDDAPPLHGRTARIAAALHLVLSGTMDSGEAVRDESAWVQVRDEAEPGWDVFDASKPIPPVGTYALLAPAAERDGVSHPHSVLALPPSHAHGASIPLALHTTGPGTFTIHAESALPDGWTADLVDTVTGQQVSLADPYAFQSEATDWTDRFQLTLQTVPVGAEDRAADGDAVSALVPNPATNATTFTVSVLTSQHVRADVVDALGRRVATLLDAHMRPGTPRAIRGDVRSLAPGTYVVRVEGETFAQTRRLTVLR